MNTKSNQVNQGNEAKAIEKSILSTSDIEQINDYNFYILHNNEILDTQKIKTVLLFLKEKEIEYPIIGEKIIGSSYTVYTPYIAERYFGLTGRERFLSPVYDSLRNYYSALDQSSQAHFLNTDTVLIPKNFHYYVFFSTVNKNLLYAEIPKKEAVFNRTNYGGAICYIFQFDDKNKIIDFYDDYTHYNTVFQD